MWNGRDPKKEITFDGATLRLGRALGGGHHHPRGDAGRAAPSRVPVGHRRTRPVHGWELEDIVRARGLSSSPATRSASTRVARRGRPRTPSGPTAGPSGLAQSAPRASRLLPAFLRDHDVSVLVWDMLDHLPIGYDIPWAVHAAPLRLRRRAPRQRAARAARAGVRGGAARRVHADDRPAGGRGRHRLAREPARGVLSVSRSGTSARPPAPAPCRGRAGRGCGSRRRRISGMLDEEIGRHPVHVLDEEAVGERAGHLERELVHDVGRDRRSGGRRPGADLERLAEAVGAADVGHQVARGAPLDQARGTRSACSCSRRWPPGS